MVRLYSNIPICEDVFKVIVLHFWMAAVCDFSFFSTLDRGNTNDVDGRTTASRDLSGVEPDLKCCRKSTSAHVQWVSGVASRRRLLHYRVVQCNCVVYLYYTYLKSLNSRIHSIEKQERSESILKNRFLIFPRIFKPIWLKLTYRLCSRHCLNTLHQQMCWQRRFLLLVLNRMH